MNIHLRFVVALVVVATMGAADREASAQGIGQLRPQGLFRGARTTQARESLDVNASLIEAWDRDAPPRLLSQIDRGSPQAGGLSTLLNAAAQYVSRGSRTQIAANATSTIRHYAEVGKTQSVGHSAGFGVNVPMAARLTLMANQSASYSPTYYYGLFPRWGEIAPGDAGSTEPDFAINDGRESINYVSTVSMRHEQGRRRALTVGGDYRYTDRLHETPSWQDKSFYRLRANYSFDISRNSSLGTGVRYGYGGYGYSGSGSTTEVGFQVGWNHTRRLSATRSVALSMSVGVSGADLQTVEDGFSSLRRRYRGTGDFGVSFPVGATWQMTGYVRRGFDNIPDLPTPVYTTGWSVGTTGLITRRVDVIARAGYSEGGDALSANSYDFDTYTGTVRVRYAINQMFATFGEYVYYYYLTRGNTQLLLSGSPTGLERNGVRAGLTIWVPALRR